MKKKMLVLLTALAVLLPSLPALAQNGTTADDGIETVNDTAISIAAESGTCGDDLTWSFDDGTLTINGEGKMYDFNELPRPWSSLRTATKKIVINEGVTEIGSSAFIGFDRVIEIAIPTSLTAVGEMAFYGCSKLREVHIKDLAAWCAIRNTGKLTTPIFTDEHDLYVNDKLLTDLVIPDGVTTIGESVFFDCSSLTSVTIPDSVTTIGNYAFGGCTALTSVTIGDSVTTIGDVAFDGCTALTSVTIPDSVTTIGSVTFSHCTALTSVTIGDSVTEIGGGAFGYCYSLREICIPDSVTEIGDDAFSFCYSLKKISIPDSVTEIGWSAFMHCVDLTDISIGKGVTKIGDQAFYGCTALENVYINDLAAWCNIHFKEVDSNPLYYAQHLYINGELTTDIVVPDGVTYCDSFKGFSGITSVTLPDTCEMSEPSFAFYGCSRLTAVNVYDSNPEYCSIDGVLFNKAVTELIYCPGGKTECIIPDSVTYTGSYAFYGCSGLTSINVSEDNQNYCSIDGVLFNKAATELIRCPGGKTEYIIPDSVTEIGGGAFGGCTALKTVTIPDSVTEIGSSAFYDCSALTSIVIPDSVTEIGDWAFSGTAWYNDGSNWENGYLYAGKCLLKARDISGSCTIRPGTVSICAYAFSDCSGLTSVTIPDSVTTIGEDAFRGCSGLTSVTIGSGVTSVGSYAFSSCSGLTTVNFNAVNCTSMGSSSSPVFQSCSSLRTLNIGENVTIIPAYAFYDCSALSSVTIPDSVTTIGNYAFCDCSALSSVTIPDSVTTIGNYAFRGCSALKTVTIPDSVTTIGEDAFYGCSALTSVNIPDSVTSIGWMAFCDCFALKTVRYGGSKEDWSKIDIGYGNGALKNATIIYNCKPAELSSPDVQKTETDTVWQFNVTVGEPRSNFFVYAAVYDENGNLTGMSRVPLDQTGSASASVTKTDKDKAARIFVWNGEMEPLTKPAGLDL